MPRRSVDEMSVSTLNRIERDIEAEKQKPGLVRVGGVGAERQKARVGFGDSFVSVMGTKAHL